MESTGVADSITASASRHGFAARDMTLEVTGTCADCRRV
jgi:Fur family zinc uptake transcriptional regulator